MGSQSCVCLQHGDPGSQLAWREAAFSEPRMVTPELAINSTSPLENSVTLV